VPLHTRHLNSIICHTKMSTLQGHSYGSGSPSVLTKYVKVFTWLLLMDRLNVRNILRRKKHKLQGNNYNCVLCLAQCEETTIHLFFSCLFSLRCWQHLNINWRFDLQFHSMMEETRHTCNNDFFMEIFIVGAWQIWKERNNLIFNRANPSFRSWKLGDMDGTETMQEVNPKPEWPGSI
jgi:hypothetical protein